MRKRIANKIAKAGFISRYSGRQKKEAYKKLKVKGEWRIIKKSLWEIFGD